MVIIKFEDAKSGWEWFARENRGCIFDELFVEFDFVSQPLEWHNSIMVAREENASPRLVSQ
jgi:hypothetical protein